MNEKEQNLLNSILQVVSGKEEQIDEIRGIRPLPIRYKHGNTIIKSNAPLSDTKPKSDNTQNKEQMDKKKFKNELKELESLQKMMDQNDVQYILGEILKRTKDIQNGEMQFVNSVMYYSNRLDKELSHTRDISKKLNTLMEKFKKKGNIK